MSGEFWRDLATIVLLLAGAFMSLAAGVGLLRFTDMLQRLHAQSKPQSAGLLFILIGLAIQQNGWAPALMLVPVLVFQFLTTPTAAHTLARGGYRSRRFEDADLFIDELEDDVARAQRAEEAEARREAAQAARDAAATSE
ncbi:monovalent cation/H(+) antiporter subunit G [Gulosibacter macacae]|uniref:Monovalent cation/H(+) antiporter subunit G n=1 Tax=Gulosibacter macacae TaxID=2488791 RepID=A0A3P3W341_9MICO|nr:monovalent cation/H(+) antiporter subunit G [Gulosibacter macacae]RRJ88346.1 monovalent cation/H(+) antiporter subunit G [Gulosibacter macacae]